MYKPVIRKVYYRYTNNEAKNQNATDHSGNLKNDQIINCQTQKRSEEVIQQLYQECRKLGDQLFQCQQENKKLELDYSTLKTEMIMQSKFTKSAKECKECRNRKSEDTQVRETAEGKQPHLL